jgi:hypothetical protein
LRHNQGDRFPEKIKRDEGQDSLTPKKYNHCLFKPRFTAIPEINKPCGEAGLPSLWQ